MVFEIALGGHSTIGLYSRKQFKSFCNLAGVCRLWRNIAWSIPCSGTTVNLDRWTLSQHPNKSVLMSQFREEASRWLSLADPRGGFHLGLKGSYDVCFDLGALAENLLSCFNLEITTLMINSEDTLIYLLNSTFAYPSIESVVITHSTPYKNTSENLEPGFARFGDVFPRLKTLQISSRQITFDPPFNLKNLTSLYIQDLRDAKGTFSSFLQSLPALETLRLSAMEPLFLRADEEDEWTHTTLKHLQVESSDFYHHLGVASFPSLEFLSLWSFPDEAGDYLDEMAEGLIGFIEKSRLTGITLCLNVQDDFLKRIKSCVGIARRLVLRRGVNAGNIHLPTHGMEEIMCWEWKSLAKLVRAPGQPFSKITIFLPEDSQEAALDVDGRIYQEKGLELRFCSWKEMREKWN